MKEEIVRERKYKLDKKKLEKELMFLWQKIVKDRAGNICEYPGCNKTENLNAHHVFSRSRGSTKYDPQNGMCLCPYHHTLGNEAAHKDCEFFMKILGEIPGYTPIRSRSWYQILRLRANTPAKSDLKMEKLYLEQELAKFR